MRHSTLCKFCQKPVFLEIDDAYSDLGDPLSLITLASCNLCADLRVRRRTLEEKIKRVCVGVFQTGKTPKGNDLEQLREALTALTRAYCKLIAEWHNMSGMAWDVVMVDLLTEKPGKWANILEQTWKQFRIHCAPKA